MTAITPLGDVDSLEEGVTRVVRRSLAHLATLGIDDPLVALAAGDLSADALANFAARCRDETARR
jgi:hypothetical protein